MVSVLVLTCKGQGGECPRSWRGLAGEREELNVRLAAGGCWADSSGDKLNILVGDGQ